MDLRGEAGVGLDPRPHGPDGSTVRVSSPDPQGTASDAPHHTHDRPLRLCRPDRLNAHMSAPPGYRHAPSKRGASAGSMRSARHRLTSALKLMTLGSGLRTTYTLRLRSATRRLLLQPPRHFLGASAPKTESRLRPSNEPVALSMQLQRTTDITASIAPSFVFRRQNLERHNPAKQLARRGPIRPTRDSPRHLASPSLASALPPRIFLLRCAPIFWGLVRKPKIKRTLRAGLRENDAEHLNPDGSR